ncbi:MAG: hypothetical protein ABR583_01185 [Gaiellaceae bacterium]
MKFLAALAAAATIGLASVTAATAATTTFTKTFGPVTIRCTVSYENRDANPALTPGDVITAVNCTVTTPAPANPGNGTATLTTTFTKTVGVTTLRCTVTYVDRNRSGTLTPGDVIKSVSCLVQQPTS